MTFRTILTITGPHMGDDDLKLAADLCDEIGAHLAVLAVVMAAPPPVGEYAAIVSEDWLKERQADEKLLKKRAFAVSAFLANIALDAAAYLARHGVKVTVDRLPSENHSVADVLRQHSVDSSAELMVMGTYGHSRLHERIFGGVTKSMVEDQSMPVLMAR